MGRVQVSGRRARQHTGGGADPLVEDKRVASRMDLRRRGMKVGKVGVAERLYNEGVQSRIFKPRRRTGLKRKSKLSRAARRRAMPGGEW